MKQKFIFNLSLLLLLNLLVKPFYILGIDTEILNRVGQSEYGLYFALLNLSFLMNIFLDMGIVNFNTSNIAKNQHLVSKHFSSIFSARIFLSFMYIIICVICASILDYNEKAFSLLLPICLNQIMVGFILYFRSNLAGLQLFKRDSIISILDRSLLIVFCSVVLWADFLNIEMSIELFIYLQMAAYLITFLVAFLTLRPHLKRLKIRMNIPFNIVVLKKSFPYALLILLMGFYYRTDGVMLERMLDDGAYEAGIYAQAFRFFEAGNMLAYLFGALLFPMFSNLLGKKEDVSQLMNLAFKIITVFALLAGIISYHYSEEIMALRFETEIENASRAFQYLMIGFTGICGTYVFGALLTANENLKELNIMALSGVFLNIVLNIFLIPDLKAEGAAIASMITQLSMAVLQIILVKWKLSVWPGFRTIMQFAILVGAVLLAVHFSIYISANWIGQIAFIGLIGLILSFLTKLIDFNNIRSYLQLIKNYKDY